MFLVFVVPLVIISLLCLLGDGFCNYEIFESPDNRGMYNWTEQIVSPIVPQRLNCSFDPQNLEAGGMAERICMANLQWADYNGEQCATFDTALLRMLATVIDLFVAIIEF